MKSVVLVCVLLFQSSFAQYYLLEQYQGSNFFSGFGFQNITDPTHGDVIYVDEDTAWNNGYVNVSGNSVYLGVDHSNVSPNGRESVRIQSYKQYAESLIVLELSHMPGSACGTWPAFWTTLGSDWPNSGEIDIIEGVSLNTANQMTMHTGSGCSNDLSLPHTGIEESWFTTNCIGETGCALLESQNNSFGSDFNNNGGGVFALERTNSSIQIWFFDPSSIPSDALGSSPNPSAWTTPSFAMALDDSCTPSHFGPHNIIFNIDFCGDWAGSVFSQQCSQFGNSCSDYVNNNPSAFVESYFMIETLNVYVDASMFPEDSMI